MPYTINAWRTTQRRVQMLKEDRGRNDGRARITRRDFLRIGGLTVLGSALAACGAAAPATPGAGVAPTAAAPVVLKGATVKYLAGPWSFLPELDTVIEAFANDWAKQTGVTVTFER